MNHYKIVFTSGHTLEVQGKLYLSQIDGYTIFRDERDNIILANITENILYVQNLDNEYLVK